MRPRSCAHPRSAPALRAARGRARRPAARSAGFGGARYSATSSDPAAPLEPLLAFSRAYRPPPRDSSSWLPLFDHPAAVEHDHPVGAGCRGHAVGRRAPGAALPGPVERGREWSPPCVRPRRSGGRRAPARFGSIQERPRQRDAAASARRTAARRVRRRPSEGPRPSPRLLEHRWPRRRLPQALDRVRRGRLVEGKLRCCARPWSRRGRAPAARSRRRAQTTQLEIRHVLAVQQHRAGLGSAGAVARAQRACSCPRRWARDRQRPAGRHLKETCSSTGRPPYAKSRSSHLELGPRLRAASHRALRPRRARRR